MNDTLNLKADKEVVTNDAGIEIGNVAYVSYKTWLATSWYGGGQVLFSTKRGAVEFLNRHADRYAEIDGAGAGAAEDDEPAYYDEMSSMWDTFLAGRAGRA